MEVVTKNNVEINNESDNVKEKVRSIIPKVKNILNIFEINKIISIDDSWQIRKKEIEIDIDEAISKIPILKFKENVERIRNNEDIVDIETMIKGIENKEYSQKDTEILSEFYKKYIFEGNDNTKEPTLKTLDSVLMELETELDNVEIIRQDKELSVEDIEKHRSSNNLFILDRNMSKSFGKKDSILDTILRLKMSNESNLILIYSNECKNDFDNHQNKMRLLSEREINDSEEQIAIIYQLWAINKTTNIDEFIEEFIKNLYNCAFGKSLYNILGIRNNALLDVFNEIKNEDIESYIPMFEATYIEGYSIISRYSKMIDALYNKYMEKRYYDNIKDSYKFLIDFQKNKINTSLNIEECKESEKKYGAYRLSHVKIQMRNILKNSEKYRISSYLKNKLYEDISLGDIIVYFDLNNKMQFGIVISRECDCIIRLNKVKEKARRNLDEYTVLLLDYSEITEELINNIQDRDYFSKYILPISYKDKLYSLKPTNKIRQFSSFILDLCTLNANGQANIDYNDEFKAYKNFHSEYYYDNQFELIIQDEMSKYDKHSYIARAENAEEFKDKLISYDYGIKFENKKFYLERVCRLESKRTVLIIQNYIHNISLVGADAPIANEVVNKSKS